MYRGKNVKKFVEQFVFRLFWILTRKSCDFAGKFLAGLSKILWRVQWNTYRAKFPIRKSWKLEDFRIVFEVFGTMAENNFQCWQNSNRCPREQFLKTFFLKRRIRYFFQFWANVYFQRKVSPELRNTQSMYPWKFLGKNSFWNTYNLSHFFRTLIQKTLGRKENFFPGCHNCNPHVQRHFLRKK